MTDNVVVIQKPPPRIWICDCGCSTFNLLETGDARCAGCDAEHDAGGWSPDHLEREYTGEIRHDVSGNGSVDFARKRIERFSQSEGVALIVAATDVGKVSVWTTAETSSQFSWVQSMLEVASDLVKKGIKD